MKAEIGEEIERIVRGLGRLGLAEAQARALVRGENAGLSPERDLALIGFDADSVQEQIFASPRPVTIQGASDRLAAWDWAFGNLGGDEHRAGVLDKDAAVALYAGGGKAVLIARAGDAEAIRTKLEDAFYERTAGWPCTTASVPLSPRELARGPAAAVEPVPPALPKLAERIGWCATGGGGFGACMALLALAMRAERVAPSHRFYLREELSGPRCEECAVRPRLPGRAEEPREKWPTRCDRCDDNHRDGAETKKEWAQAGSFDDVLGERGAPGEDPKRARHIAFLKLDGRGIGGRLERLGSIAEYVALSRALHHAFEMTEAKLVSLGVPERRFQIPIAGGDDLLLVVPARWKPTGQGDASDAFTLARALLKRVERTFDDAARTGFFAAGAGIDQLGAGAGLVIASGMPASFCFRYTDDLVKSAKAPLAAGSDGKHRSARHRSALDFAVLRGGSPLAESLDRIRARDVLDLDLGPDLAGKVKRTRCPYVLADLDALIERTRRLAGAPRSAVHALHTAMREPTTGMLAVRYQLSRHPDLRRALTGDAPLGALPPHLGEWVLNNVGDRLWATGIGDLLDALPFVSAAEEAA